MLESHLSDSQKNFSWGQLLLNSEVALLPIERCDQPISKVSERDLHTFTGAVKHPRNWTDVRQRINKSQYFMTLYLPLRIVNSQPIYYRRLIKKDIKMIAISLIKHQNWGWFLITEGRRKYYRKLHRRNVCKDKKLMVTKQFSYALPVDSE